MINRREAIKSTAIAAAVIAGGRIALAQAFVDGRIQPLFSLPPLAYAFDALEPYIDTETLKIHYQAHHASYVGRLNEAMPHVLDLYFAITRKGGTLDSLEQLLKDLGSVPEKIRSAVRDSGGGHYNHSLFWQFMKAKGGGEPAGNLARAIEKSFTNFAGFKDQFTKAALTQFGSGWAWLTLDQGSLKVETTANQDNPVSAGRPVLLGIDVWEHAYYLKYQNKRADYIAAWFNVINWDFVSERYEKLKS